MCVDPAMDKVLCNNGAASATTKLQVSMCLFSVRTTDQNLWMHAESMSGTHAGPHPLLTDFARLQALQPQLDELHEQLAQLTAETQAEKDKLAATQAEAADLQAKIAQVRCIQGFGFAQGSTQTRGVVPKAANTSTSDQHDMFTNKQCAGIWVTDLLVDSACYSHTLCCSASSSTITRSKWPGRQCQHMGSML